MTPNQPKNTPSAIDEILKALNQPKESPAQQEAKKQARLKYNRALNTMFSTEYGQHVLSNIVAYCKWDSIYNYKPEDRVMIQVQQELVREMILSRLTTENLTKLLKSLRKGE